MSLANRPPLAERAQHRWASILPLIGIGREFLSKKNGPCPMCGGRNCWRWINRDGSGDWWCNACTHGSGTDLVKLFLKVDFKRAAERIEAVLGETKMESAKPRDDRMKRASMVELWSRSGPIRPDSPAALYLRSRGLALTEYPKCLRWCPYAPYDAETHHPAMLAQVIDPNGKAVNIHRTFIDNNGRKTGRGTPRKMMPGSKPPGCAIRLYPPAIVMGVAEGIESTLAAAQLFGVPAWSAIDAENMMRFKPPPMVKHLIVFADSDENFTGQAAAYTLARKAVLDFKIEASVEIPPTLRHDWNDVLCSKMGAAA